MVLGMPTNSQRREALETLPNDLYDSFQGIITRIRKCPAGQAALGMQVLMWLHFSYRPLKLVELQHALAVKKTHKEFDAGNIPPRKALLDCCFGLVVVDEETLIVRLVHYSLEEYFCKFSKEEFPHGYSQIAETCLTYLNFDQLRQHCANLDDLRENRNKYAFLDYAARYWGTYVKQQPNDELANLAKVIVDHESERPPCAIQALFLELVILDNPSIPQKFSGIHAIAFFGWCEMVEYFCEMERNVDLKDDHSQTPLSWAAKEGHKAVVQWLRERNNIDINVTDNDKRTALTLAARKGCDLNAMDGRGWTPLHDLASNGHETVARVLIERNGVDINAKANNG